MRSQVAIFGVVGSLLLTTCGEPAAELANVGEPCVESIDCRDELVCDQNACADDSGPSVSVHMPTPMTAFDHGADISVGVLPEDLGEGDSLELTLDPHGPAPVSVPLIPDGIQFSTYGMVPGPAEPGAYWLRVRVLDSEGQPYPNPSATQYVSVFVRDPIHPDKPLIALLAPRPDHQHVLGNDVDVQVGVLPGSFTFTNFVGTDCPPLEGCADPFAPECEDECGPISRVGHAKLYLRDDYPQCLFDLPVGCNGDYVALIRPAEGTQIDAYILGTTLAAEQLEVGDLQLTAALSYDYHQPYPTDEAVIHTTQALAIVDPAD